MTSNQESRQQKKWIRSFKAESRSMKSSDLLFLLDSECAEERSQEGSEDHKEASNRDGTEEVQAGRALQCEFHIWSTVLLTCFAQHFDSDGSGFIEKNELQSFMKRFIYQGLELSEEELLAALEVVDTNKVRELGWLSNRLLNVVCKGWQSFTR